MSTPAWLARLLDRAPTDRAQRVAITLLSVVLIAAALLLTIETVGTSSEGNIPSPRDSGRVDHVSPGDLDPGDLELQSARLLARHFLRGYLAFVYGHKPASAVPDAGPGILAALASHPRVPPGLARLRPRVVAVSATRTGDASNVAVTAMVRDGEVVTYPIRLLVIRSRLGKLIVAKVR